MQQIGCRTRCIIVIDSPEAWLARRIINRLSEILFLVTQPEDPECVRVSGDMVCDLCGEVYYRHAKNPHARFLNVTCEGTNVKL